MRTGALVAVAILLAGCGGADPAGSTDTTGPDGSGADGGPLRPDPATSGFAILGVSHYRDTIGYLHVVGEVENRGAEARPVQVEAQLSGADGASAGSTFTYACLPMVPPGGRSGFNIHVRDPDAAVQSWQLIPVPGAPGPAVELEVTGTPRLDGGRERIDGTVTNPGATGAAGVKVCATFLDGDGLVADVASAAPEPRDLGPGATGTYSLRALRDAAPYAERRLAAQAAEAGT